MRELPEPTAHMWQHGETGNTGFVQHAPQEELEQWEKINRPRSIVAPLYSEYQVIAIQKQAYEDGLREACRVQISSEMLQAGAEEFDGWAKENQGTYECIEAVFRAMLTASQKEQQ